MKTKKVLYICQCLGLTSQNHDKRHLAQLLHWSILERVSFGIKITASRRFPFLTSQRRDARVFYRV
jgi:hypothetical protein